MAEQYKTEQIIIGAAKVYASVKDSTDATWGAGPALPAGTVSQSLVSVLDASTEWRHLGFTSGGVEFTYTPDFGEVEVDQLLDSARLFKQRMTASVATTLSQATLENIVLAWGQAASTLGADGTSQDLNITSGALGDEPVERSLIFIGPAPRATGGQKRERVYFLRRALQVEASAHSLNRAEATQIPVSFRLLPNPTYSTNQYGIIRDRNISA